VSVTKLKIRRMSIYTERACPHKRQHFGSEGTRRYRKSYCRTGELSKGSGSFRSSRLPQPNSGSATILVEELGVDSPDQVRMTCVASPARLPPGSAFPFDGSMLAAVSSLSDCCDKAAKRSR